MVIKVCGFKRIKDIEIAIELKIDYIGFNFYSKSPRYLPFDDARELLKRVPADVGRIGVFVNETCETIGRFVSGVGLSGIQLHGNETPEFCLQVKKCFPEQILIKAFRIHSTDDFDLMQQYEPDFFLLDAFDKRVLGGSGKRIDSNLLRQLPIRFSKVFIAGGITPDNAFKIVENFQPYGIDVASGVEIRPGIKDHKKMRELVLKLKKQSN